MLKVVRGIDRVEQLDTLSPALGGYRIATARVSDPVGNVDETWGSG